MKEIKGQPMINHGFQVPIIKESDFFLGEGNLPRIVLQENGNWKDSLPEAEKQLRGIIDSINCTAFATTEQIEAYERKAFGEQNNYSDRFVALISSTTPQGNDPAKVYDAIRDYGLVPEEMCPWSPDIQTVEEYLSWKGVDKDACIAEGKKWKERKDFMHNWVYRATAPLNEKINNMIVALRYSPLCFDVSAWEQNSEGKYIRFGMSGHWTMGYNIGDFIDVRDSYPPHEKQLVRDFNFFYCKRISITKKTPLTYPQKKSIWQIIISFLWKEPEEIKRLEPDLNPDFVSPKTRPTETKPKVEEPKLKWEFPSDARKSVRILCDELGLTVAEKNLIAAVITAESGMKIKATNKNNNGSTDYSLCQFNDGPPNVPSNKKWWIGQGKAFSTPQDVFDNPERQVKIMIQQYRAGRLNNWYAYTNGSYKRYL